MFSLFSFLPAKHSLNIHLFDTISSTWNIQCEKNLRAYKKITTSYSDQPPAVPVPGNANKLCSRILHSRCPQQKVIWGTLRMFFPKPIKQLHKVALATFEARWYIGNFETMLQVLSQNGCHGSHTYPVIKFSFSRKINDLNALTYLLGCPLLP